MIGFPRGEAEPIGKVRVLDDRCPKYRAQPLLPGWSSARGLAIVACLVLLLQCGATATSLLPATVTPQPPGADRQRGPTDAASDEQEPRVSDSVLRPISIERAFAPLSFKQPVQLAHAGDGSGRLFIVEQPGRIMVFDSDAPSATAQVFLDIRDRVNNSGSEEGLLGLAFDPAFTETGHLFVYYSASGPRRSVLSRFSTLSDQTDEADPASELVVMEIPQPYMNHNGGQVLFGPDGYLYIGLGDGGSRGDPDGNGQDLSTLLGSILRIDVGSAGPERPYRIPPDNPFLDVNERGAREEIWAYGLRNPWRFSFDSGTGHLWAGDVGQNRYEEIDLIRPGRNYGWNALEATHCFPPSQADCDRTGFESPVVEYAIRENGCSVIGGHVYRGSHHPSLRGAYVYGDFCSGRVWALRYDGRQVTEHIELVDTDLQISAFGEGPAGEIYIVSYGDGRLYKLVSE